MIKKFNGKILKYGNRINSYSLGIDIEIVGTYFPRVSTTSSRYYFNLRFSSASSITIDYGNGQSVIYATKGSTNQVYIVHPGLDAIGVNEYAYYAYPDGLNINRIIRIIIPEASKVILFQLYNAFSKAQPLRVKFDQFPNLETLSLSFLPLLDIDDSYIQNESVKTIVMRNAFDGLGRYYGAIPIKVLDGKAYQTFNWGDNSFSNKSFSLSNLDKITTMLDLIALKSLSITSSALLDDNAGEGALPANFINLQVTTLDVQQNSFTTVPSVINSITTITLLNVQVMDSLTSLGDFRNLINLTDLRIGRCPNLAVALPAWFNALVNLKNIDNRALGQNTPAKVDLWVTEVYDFITANAAMTGASSLPFRGMRIRIENFDSFIAAIPGGTYQQPAGYSSGVSNGIPTSSLERIWALVNQYAHTWSYRAI